MLIRITRNKEGIEHYFETAQKKGRKHERDELDHRVHLGGDLSTFRITTNYIKKEKSWKDRYWHITASFAAENGDLDDDTLREIHREMLEYYYCDYNIDNLIYSAEAHKPRIQSELDKSTGELKQRLLHFHMAVSKYDPITGNQIRMIPFNEKADRAFQSYLCEKYNLVDPADKLRAEPITKKDIISRWKGDDISAQTKVNQVRSLILKATKNAQNIDDTLEILNKFDYVKSAEYKVQKSGNKYIQIKTNLGTKNINLRGKGFEHLEDIYYTFEEKFKRNIKPKKSNKEIIEEHKNWFLSEQKKRAPKSKSSIETKYEKAQKKYQSYYEKYTKEQRQYFVIYRTNIKSDFISGYRIFEKNNQRYLVNNDLNIKIYDRPDNITLDLPNNPEEQRKAIALALSMAKAKGWDLNTMKVSGSFEFQQEVKRQIAELNFAKEQPDFKLKKHKVKKPTKPLLNSVNSQIEALKDKQRVKLSKEQISALKTDLDASLVIKYAADKLQLIPEHFEVTENNKIKDKRTKSKPKNIIDFMTKTCNQPISQSMALLQDMFKKQQLKQEKDLENLTSEYKNESKQDFHKRILFDALKSANDFKSLVSSIKGRVHLYDDVEITNKYTELKIGNETYKFEDLGLSRDEVIEALKKNGGFGGDDIAPELK